MDDQHTTALTPLRCNAYGYESMDDLFWHVTRMAGVFVVGLSVGYCIGYPIKESDDRKLAELGKRIDEIEREFESS